MTAESTCSARAPRNVRRKFLDSVSPFDKLRRLRVETVNDCHPFASEEARVSDDPSEGPPDGARPLQSLPMGAETQAELAVYFRNWYPRLKAEARRNAGARADAIDPSQIALDLLVKAARRRRQFRGSTTAELWSWLKAGLVRDVLTGLSRMKNRAASLHGVQTLATVDDRQEVDICDLYDAIDSLSPDDRELICLYHGLNSQMSKAALAQLLGYEPDNLKQRARRIREKLKIAMTRKRVRQGQ